MRSFLEGARAVLTKAEMTSLVELLREYGARARGGVTAAGAREGVAGAAGAKTVADAPLLPPMTGEEVATRAAPLLVGRGGRLAERFAEFVPNAQKEAFRDGMRRCAGEMVYARAAASRARAAAGAAAAAAVARAGDLRNVVLSDGAGGDGTKGDPPGVYDPIAAVAREAAAAEDRDRDRRRAEAESANPLLRGGAGHRVGGIGAAARFAHDDDFAGARRAAALAAAMAARRMGHGGSKAAAAVATTAEGAAVVAAGRGGRGLKRTGAALASGRAAPAGSGPPLPSAATRRLKGAAPVLGNTVLSAGALTPHAAIRSGRFPATPGSRPNVDTLEEFREGSGDEDEIR